MSDLECKIGFGSLLFSDGWYTDQLRDDGKKVHRVWFSRYLKKEYGITPEEYMTICLYGSKDNLPTCYICNERKVVPVDKIRPLCGFNSICDSPSCKSEHRRRTSMIGLNKVNSQYEFMSIDEKREVTKSAREALRLSRSNPDDIDRKIKDGNAVIMMAYTRLINAGSPDDTLYFYIAKDIHGKFKFGVTYSTWNRQYGSGYTKMKVICSGIRHKVAELEKLIKFDLNRKLYSTSEYLEFDQVHYFRESYRNHYKELF